MKPNDDGAAWSIVGYLLSGMLFWGGVGWALDHWFKTHYFLLGGLLLGVSASIYLIWLRIGRNSK